MASPSAAPAATSVAALNFFLTAATFTSQMHGCSWSESVMYRSEPIRAISMGRRSFEATTTSLSAGACETLNTRNSFRPMST
eukprot:5662112-Prymnesium_polylepis.1